MNQRNQLLCAWSGVVFALLFGLGFWTFAGFFPPHYPSASAEQIAAIFRADTGMIRLGQVLLMAGSALTIPFAAVISVQLMRIEGRHAVMAITQFGAAAAGVFILILPAMLWTSAAFRPERAPELTLLLNDTAWLLFLMTFSPATVQLLAIGISVLGDKATAPVFPRWAGFFNLWMAVLFLPGGLMTFFKTGPFAWNGLFGFWIPALAFFSWVIVMTVLLIQTIKRQPQDER
ncbi:MAG: hypothetical protein JWQ90_1815 [Hydrocarboniphaga sp.]|uniref:hypothetical protein n=1 Tax=Hydrocarboniphaga sp. TaxID=2033016 RepID=UPI00261C9957|nr:hypothetical protein [Hydrocarboniphaga sp.]MDB5969365.1 hypothetical protein [Hydrocarboniphaga sp.]